MNITTMSELLGSYKELLDECYPWITINGCTFRPSEVLEKLDPLGFRQGYLDFADFIGIDVDELEDDL